MAKYGLDLVKALANYNMAQPRGSVIADQQHLAMPQEHAIAPTGNNQPTAEEMIQKIINSPLVTKPIAPPPIQSQALNLGMSKPSSLKWTSNPSTANKAQEILDQRKALLPATNVPLTAPTNVPPQESSSPVQGNKLESTGVFNSVGNIINKMTAGSNGLNSISAILAGTKNFAGAQGFSEVADNLKKEELANQQELKAQTADKAKTADAQKFVTESNDIKNAQDVYKTIAEHGGNAELYRKTLPENIQSHVAGNIPDLEDYKGNEAVLDQEGNQFHLQTSGSGKTRYIKITGDKDKPVGKVKTLEQLNLERQAIAQQLAQAKDARAQETLALQLRRFDAMYALALNNAANSLNSRSNKRLDAYDKEIQKISEKYNTNLDATDKAKLAISQGTKVGQVAGSYELAKFFDTGKLSDKDVSMFYGGNQRLADQAIRKFQTFVTTGLPMTKKDVSEMIQLMNALGSTVTKMKHRDIQAKISSAESRNIADRALLEAIASPYLIGKSINEENPLNAGNKLKVISRTPNGMVVLNDNRHVTKEEAIRLGAE